MGGKKIFLFRKYGGKIYTHNFFSVSPFSAPSEPATANPQETQG
jgi:uncharacterized protein YneR